MTLGIPDDELHIFQREAEDQDNQDSPDSTCSPKIIQLLITPNDSNWQGILLGLADNGDTYRLDHADGWVIWFDGISKQNGEEANS